MENKATQRLSRNDWILGALEMAAAQGINGVKVVPLANRLGVTSGSFYWHFTNRRALYDAVLDYWESAMTDAAIVSAWEFAGTPTERIWYLMEQVMTRGLAHYDLAIWQWAQSDTVAKSVFDRAVRKRFEFGAQMFRQAGFDPRQAEARGRLMAVYMMGESTLVSDTEKKRKKNLRLKFEILTAKP
jgi:AcrR family transcriptional regulator